MEEPEVRDWFQTFKDGGSDQVTLVIERATVEPGTSFSEEALEAVRNQMILFVGARLMAAWDQRHVPPTRCEINIGVSIQ